MKPTPSVTHPQRRLSHLRVAAIIASALTTMAGPNFLHAEEARGAKVIAEHSLPLFSLANFGHSETELAIALTNGLPTADYPAIGSGLQRLAGNHFLSVTDRGPTFTRTTPTPGRVFPLPTYTPCIIFFKAGGGEITPQTILPVVVDDAGTPATGISNSSSDDSIPFESPTATTQLPFNPNGLDLEDIHTLPDGNFIAVDEYSPSLAIISDTGRVLKRYTPVGKPLSGSTYAVSATLPGILTQRRANRGFEAIALANDGHTAYTMTQSPLGPTGANTPTRNSRVLRVLRLDITDPLNVQVTAQYVLLMSEASTFPTGNRPQDLKLSAAVWVSANKLLLLERSDEPGIGGAKLILADFAEATDVTGLPIAQTLALEDSALDLASVGITPASTTVVYRNEETPEITDFKLEGLDLLNRNEVAITNDNDFGIGVPVPAASKLWVIRLAQPLF